MSAEALELAARRTAAARLGTIARWCGDRAAQIAPVFDAEDHRSIRAALRGAAAGTAPEERRAGLIPTPTLLEKALEELSHQPTPAAVAALLLAWDHPLAAAIIAEARREQPDLFVLEQALDAGFAARAASVARRDGPALRDFVHIIAVAQRAWTALLAPDPEKALEPLRHALPKTELGELLAAGVPGTDEIDRAALATLLKVERRHAREDPLGLGPVLYFVARLRSELRDLSWIGWGIALGAPRPRLAEGVVSP
jgi:vacuolar-type H+-ATPase subunit C/Vma6